MEPAIIDSDQFNALPEKPAFIENFVKPKSQQLIAVPLHRHESLKVGEKVIWSFNNGRMEARVEIVVNTETLDPLFWFRNSNRDFVAYEFFDKGTSKLFTYDADLFNNEAYNELFSESTIPKNFGVSGLWWTYSNYISGKENEVEIFLDQQEKDFTKLLEDPKFQDLIENKSNGSFLNPPLECDGFNVAGLNPKLSFVEIDVKDRGVMYVLRQEFADSLQKEFPVFPLCAGGMWGGHYVSPEEQP